MRVEAILHSGDARRAIVNGKVVRAGDRVSGVQIDAILGDSVRYVRDGQRARRARCRHAKIAVRPPSALHAGEP